MKKIIKKLLIYFMSVTLFLQLTGSVFNIKKVYALDKISFLGENVDFYVEETPFKIAYIAVMEDGQIYNSEYNKITKKVYMNGHEVIYSIEEGITINAQNKSNINNISSVYSTTNPWTPVTVVEGYYINFAPFIDSVASVAAFSLQLHMSLAAVASSQLMGKLVEHSVKEVMNRIADTAYGALIDYLAANASDYFTATFYYDLQRTSGLVDLMGSGVLVTAYRYANYAGRIWIGGRQFSCNTAEYGSWWSSSKPYSIELPGEYM
jgi:hypothetical protein